MSNQAHNRSKPVVNATTMSTLLGGGQRATRRGRLYRALDISGAALAILLVLPLFAVLSLMILCEGQGPVLVRYRRVRADASQHYLLKFRTERPGTNGCVESAGSRLGAVLLTTGLDEIPLLISVLKGDLPICGHYSWRQVMAWLSALEGQDQ
jgi:lipopolysaccharide/colanic/teichoic acid biosynthesis glycosyltransferase